MILVALGLLALSLYCAIFEAIEERDWPRETIKYVGLALLVLIAFLY
jgi:hypothetical protein